ncbi:MAG: SulP family inorganic anion transporter, partial [Pseudomonadota bacterium]|nr:SulP family inorganic anion transporter [Pseudomonadota bacterium]
IAAGKWMGLAGYGIAQVGTIALQVGMPSLPQISYVDWLRIAELSVAMVLIVYAESYSSIRTFALKHGDTVSPNRDLLALGAANLVSGLFHGMAVGAGFSGTSANEAAGATSKMAGWFAALTLLAIVLTLLPAIALTPEPVLAAIVIHAVSHTLRPAVFKPYFRWRRDRIVIFGAVLAVLMLGVLDGLLAAIALSLLMLLRRLAESTVSVLGRLGAGHDFVSLRAHPEAQPIPGMLILRPETALFFANADRILAQARRDIDAAGDQIGVVILSLEESPDLDSTALEAIGDFYKAMLEQNRHLLFARLKSPVQQVLNRAAIAGLTMAALIDLSVDDAVNAALKMYPQGAPTPVAPA